MFEMSILVFILNKQVVYLFNIIQIFSVFDSISELKKRSCFLFVVM